jgi:integrase
MITLPICFPIRLFQHVCAGKHQKEGRMKLTKTSVSELALPAGKSELFVWDDDLPGFGVRLRGEAARWVVQYRVGAQQRRESLGDIRKIELEAARKIARQRFAQAELGTDPAAERAKARAAASAAKLTLAEVTKRYLKAKVDVVRLNTYVQAKLHLEQFWKPLANLPIDSIKRADVAARLQELSGERGRTASARARANLSAMFGWAMREGLCETNPVLHTNDPAEGVEARDRVLSDRELAAVWRACENDDYGRIVKLLILTGCRREEIGALKWSEVDLDTGVLTIPGERTKNHKTHVLGLAPIAIDILRTAPKREGREFVFGERGGAFSAWSYSTVALHNRITTAEGKSIPHWVLHDLRRTMRTGLGKLGVAPHIAERVLNHIKGGVEAIYDRHRYEDEIKRALAIWADHVLAVVEGRDSKITALKRA